MSDDYTEALFRYEFEKREKIEEKVFELIRTNILILAGFVPIVSIIFQEDAKLIYDIILNYYTLSGLGLCILSISSSGGVYILSQINMIAVNNYIINQTKDEGEDIGDVRRELVDLSQEGEIADSLVYMTAISVFLTSVSVPLLLIGLADPFLSISPVLALLLVLFSIAGVWILYVTVKTSVEYIQFLSKAIPKYLEQTREVLSTVSESPDTIELQLELLRIMAAIVSAIVAFAQLNLVLFQSLPIPIFRTPLVVFDLMIELVVAIFVGLISLILLELIFRRYILESNSH